MECPASCTAIWQNFLDLHSSRSYGMAMNPISYSDIKAYFDLYGQEPENWEIQTIKALDLIAMKAASEQSKTAPKGKSKK